MRNIDTVLRRWLVVEAIGGLLILAWVALGMRGFAPAALAFAAIAGVALAAVLHSGSTAADKVTLGRLALGIVGAALVARTGAVGWVAWSVLAIAVAADLADGWAARRFGGSDAGAALDMGADQLTWLVLATVAIGFAGAPAWAIALPGIRWAWVLVGTAMALPIHDPKPVDGDNSRGRCICGAIAVALVVAIAPATPAWLATAALAASTVAIAFSYAGDARHMLRTRRAPA